jgi:hypothetical protein
VIDRDTLELCFAEALRLNSSSAGKRIALILIDNAVELMLGDLLEPCLFASRFSNQPFPYDERVKIYAEFDAKVDGAVKLDLLSQERAAIASNGHHLRNRAYHAGRSDAVIVDVILPIYFRDAVHLASTQFFQPLKRFDALSSPRLETKEVASVLIRTIAERLGRVLIKSRLVTAT